MEACSCNYCCSGIALNVAYSEGVSVVLGIQLAKHIHRFDVLLTVHLSIFISVFNQLDAQNLFHNKFYFMPLHVSSTCACARNM